MIICTQLEPQDVAEVEEDTEAVAKAKEEVAKEATQTEAKEATKCCYKA